MIKANYLSSYVLWNQQKENLTKLKTSSSKLSYYQQCKRTGEEVSYFEFLIFDRHAHVFDILIARK